MSEIRPEQPSISQPGTQEGTQGVEPTKPFNLGPTQTTAGQTSVGTGSALKNFLKTGQNQWQDPKTGTFYKVTAAKDPNPPPGAKHAELTTVTAYSGNPAQGGKPTSTSEFAVAKSSDQFSSDYTVYNKPGNEEDQNLNTQKINTIPNNLGDMMNSPLGRKVYEAFIKGIAMQIMQQSKKQQHMFSQAQKNA